MEKKQEPQATTPVKGDAEEEMKHLSRRGFIWAAAAVGGTYWAFHWINNQKPVGYKTPAEDGINWPFRKGLDFDDRVTSALYSPARLSPTYTDVAITEARQNGDLGLGGSDSSDDTDPAASDNGDGASGSASTGDSANSSPSDAFDPKSWVLHLEGASDTKRKVLKIEDVKAFHKHEFVTEFKCIEGWSFFMKWAGTRFSDFYAKYPPAAKTDYIALETPDGQYYVSIDIASALHPQTLLCYEMNGKPLALEHGAPLRLIIPHKYGVKNIKRIGKIAYTSNPPKDYWAEQGYDYFAGL